MARRGVAHYGWKDDWWVLIALIPVGFVAWIGPLYAGVRARRPWWVAVGLLWTAVWWVGALMDDVVGHDTDLSGGLLLLGWTGALATCLVMRPAFKRQLTDPGRAALEQARERTRRQAELRALAAAEPAVAKELGTRGTGLCDVNNAPVGAIERLPGVDRALARRIVEVREEVGGFTSLEELGAVLELDGALVERLRDDVVLLPR